VRGRGPNTFDRRRTSPGYPTGLTSSPTATAAHASSSTTRTTTSSWTGASRPRIEEPGTERVEYGPQHRDQRRPPAFRRRPRTCTDAGLRRERKFLDMWPLKSPHWPASQPTLFVNHFIDDKGFIWVGDAPTSRILKFDLNGNFLYSWGAPGGQAGRLNCSHGITTDQLGICTWPICFAGRLQKFEPIAGADPDKVAGQILRTWIPGSAPEPKSFGPGAERRRS